MPTPHNHPQWLREEVEKRRQDRRRRRFHGFMFWGSLAALFVLFGVQIWWAN